MVKIGRSTGNGKLKYDRKMTQADWHFDKEAQRRLKRERLLKVAAECFNQKGFSGTSLKDVAHKLNITDAALYYYVKNKEELVNLCYLRAIELAEDALKRAIKEGNTPLEQLELFIRYQVGALCGEDGPVAIMSEIPSLKPDHREYVLKHSRAHTKKITNIIKAGIKNGSMTSPNPLAACDAILGALNWIPKWFRPNSKLSSDDIADTFIYTFTQGLVSRE